MSLESLSALFLRQESYEDEILVFVVLQEP